jgi:hypothetical protein
MSQVAPGSARMSVDPKGKLILTVFPIEPSKKSKTTCVVKFIQKTEDEKQQEQESQCEGQGQGQGGGGKSSSMEEMIKQTNAMTVAQKAYVLEKELTQSARNIVETLNLPQGSISRIKNGLQKYANSGALRNRAEKIFQVLNDERLEALKEEQEKDATVQQPPDEYGDPGSGDSQSSGSKEPINGLKKTFIHFKKSNK